MPSTRAEEAREFGEQAIVCNRRLDEVGEAATAEVIGEGIDAGDLNVAAVGMSFPAARQADAQEDRVLL